jgi:hypothetical protein
MDSIEAQKQLTDRELIIFNSELDRKRKSTAVAYVLYFFLGGIGGHKFYMGKPLIGFFYALSSLGSLVFLAAAFDTSDITEDISTVLAVGSLPLLWFGIMMLLDLFTIPRQIKKQEDRARNDLLTRLLSSKI